MLANGLAFEMLQSKELLQRVYMHDNTNKSEAVLLGEWRSNPLANIPYPVREKEIYLDCTVGNITKDIREPITLQAELDGRSSRSSCSFTPLIPHSSRSSCSSLLSLLSFLWLLAQS
jgi:hypothetical protein